MKRCSKCSKEKEDKEFYNPPSLLGKLSSACRKCTRKRIVIYKKKHRKKGGKMYRHGYKSLCRRITSRAYIEGYIPKSQCQDLGCSLMKVQGHHWSYKRPIDVIWVCQRHHTRADNDPIYEQKLINNRYNHNFYYINQYFTIEK